MTTALIATLARPADTYNYNIGLCAGPADTHDIGLCAGPAHTYNIGQRPGPATPQSKPKKVPKVTLPVTLGEAWTRLSVAKGINVTIEMRGDYEARALADVPERARAAKLKQLRAADCLVTAERTVALAVDCNVDNGRLAINVGPYKYKQSRRIDVVVLADSTLREVHGQMGSNIFSRGTLRVGDLSVEAERAMEMHLSCLTNGSIHVKAHRQSIVWLTGRASAIDATIDGASFLRLKQMSAARVSLTCRDESQAEVNATTALDLTAEGKSEIRYHAPYGCQVRQNAQQGSQIIPRRILDNL